MKKNISVLLFFIVTCIVLLAFITVNSIYKVTDGKITFVSEASFETITAFSEKLNGMMDTSNQEFAFFVANKSFEGFNGLLQREHFNESYLESDKNPKSFFTGRIIEKIIFSKPGIFYVRAKGLLMIHGVEQERIIKCVLLIENGTIKVTSKFSVFLADHDINVPRIVFEKISPEIKIQVEAVMHEKIE